jgi:zinc protease
MNRRPVYILAAALLLAAPARAAARHPSDLAFRPLDFSPPGAARTVLSNGMVVYLLPDDEVPLVGVTALVRTGELYVPPERAGLASLTGHVMRTGGAGSMTPEEIDEKLEYVGASLSVDIGYDAGSAGLSVLKKDVDLGLGIFSEILMHPSFAAEKISLRKRQVAEEIRRENDVPYRILAREFRQILYGDHPYGRRVTGNRKSLAGLTRKDLVEFHARYFHPNNIILAVSGDFRGEEMLAKIEGAFGSWAREAVELPAPPPLEKRFFRSVNLVPKEINQSSIRIGHFGTTWENPDYFPITLMNYLLGGGDFTSRLVKTVRSDEGLAYYVGSSFVERHDLGFFAADCLTKSVSTSRSISLMLDTIEGMRRKSPGPEELSTARDAYINAFVFRFTTSGMIVDQLAENEYRGLPRDFLDTYVEKIKAVTGDDVLRAAREYLHPEKAIILVVGEPADFDAPLSTFGELNVIDMGATAGRQEESSVLPGPVEAPPAAAPPGDRSGREAIAGAVR